MLRKMWPLCMALQRRMLRVEWIGGNRMSGIYIPGMEMPPNCEECEWSTTDRSGFFGCRLTWNIVIRKREQDRPDWCPLIPVPPHGRLIDADALKARVQKLQEWLWDKLTDADVGIVTADDVRFRIAEESEDFIDNAPTVIPASGGNENE